MPAPTVVTDTPPSELSSPPEETRVGWLEQRLELRALYMKYGRKVFPVHPKFFVGEIAAFSFVILVITGIYLGLIYTPSNVDIDVAGQRLPQAYASVLLIESIPLANLFRTVHHWAAHVMVAAVILHALRVFLTGAYRKPREVNWVVGVVLLGLTMVAGFVGYALPYDAFAVTATGIGYALARSIPVVGGVAADIFFGGPFPTLGSLPRLYTIHVVIVPALITLLLTAHLVIVLKQKHTQPAYARRIAEPGGAHVLSLVLNASDQRLWSVMEWVALMACAFVAFAATYAFVPQVKRPVRAIVPGAAFATLAIAVFSVGFAWVINVFGPVLVDPLYGWFTGVFALLLYLYWASIILLLGGEVNNALETYGSDTAAGAVQRKPG